MLRALRHLGIFAFRVLTRPLATAAPRLPRGFEFRLFEPQDLIARCADPALELAESTARAALARGEVCVGALHSGKLAGYAWFAYRPAPHVAGVWMAFDRQAIYVYRAFVHPAHRGLGVAPALYRFADQRFIREGRRLALICIEAGNRPSIIAAERSGARGAGFAAYFQARGGFFAVRSPGAARLGFRFYLGDRDKERA